MATSQQMRSQAGATNLRLGDIIVALFLLGLLLYAAWKQFPTYASKGSSQARATQGVHQP
jgi:hypothetical protein